MLTMTAFHIIDNPHVYRRLRDELDEAIPDPDAMPAWAQLQQLPYLSACIEEGQFSPLPFPCPPPPELCDD